MDRPANITWYQGAALVFTSGKLPRVTRFHPYGEMREMFKKHRQEAKQKAFIQHQHYTRKYDEGFEMWDNGFNSIGSPNIFHLTSFIQRMDA